MKKEFSKIICVDKIDLFHHKVKRFGHNLTFIHGDFSDDYTLRVEHIKPISLVVGMWSFGYLDERKQ